MLPNSASASSCTFRRLQVADAAAYRELRLEGLLAHPQSFAAAWDQEQARPLEWFEQRLRDGLVLGAWPAQGEGLMGIAGLHVPESPKLSHKGTLWGVYLRPQARGTGLAGELLGRVLELARGRVEEVLLTVQASNDAALRLYRNAGFKEYGLERRALKIDGRYYDELLMALPLAGA